MKHLILCSALLFLVTNGAGAQDFFGVGISYGFVKSGSAVLYYQHAIHQFQREMHKPIPPVQGQALKAATHTSGQWIPYHR